MSKNCCSLVESSSPTKRSGSGAGSSGKRLPINSVPGDGIGTIKLPMPLGPCPEVSESHDFGAGSLGRHMPISWVLLQELPVIWYNKHQTISTSDPRRPPMCDLHLFP